MICMGHLFFILDGFWWVYCYNNDKKMKRNQFSYLNVRALSHASLQKFRQSAPDPPKRDPSNYQTFNPKPAVKYYTNSNENNSTVAVPLKVQKKPDPNAKKVQQQLKKKIKLLQYELKKKIGEHTHLVKLFKTKNSAEVPHIDLYLEFGQLEQQLQRKTKKVQQLEHKAQEYCHEIEQLLSAKDSHEAAHTNQIKSVINKLEKLEKKHAQELIQKDKQISQERKIKDEKDMLLRQFRKKYEECQAMISSLENEAMEARQSKQEIERIYEEKIQNTREDFMIRLEDSDKEMQRYIAKIREQQEVIKQLKDNTISKQSQRTKIVKNLEKQLQSKEKLLAEQENYLLQVKQQCQMYQKQLIQQQDKSQELQNELTNNKAQQKQKEDGHRRQMEHIKRELGQCKALLKDSQQKNQRYERQAGKLEHKISQLTATIKTLSFEREDKDLGIEKIRQKVLQKQKLLQSTQKFIQDLQCKLFTTDRKALASSQRIKQLEKQLATRKETGNNHSKIQIEHYKCIGRLIELIHQIQIYTGNDSKPEGKNQNRNRVKTIQNQEPESITECVDVLTRELEVFMKKLYTNALEQSKTTAQLLQQIICDIKSIFHAYNSFIQDEQLKGATRQYLECLESPQKSIRKSRNNYLQVIMQRLISMIAIQSYTSDQGLTRVATSKSKMKMSSKRIGVDSLENTCQDWDQGDDGGRRGGVEERILVQRRKTVEDSQDREKYRREGGQSRRKSYKMMTEHSEDVLPARRLDYGKENFLHRINRTEIAETSVYNSRPKDQTQGLSRNYRDQVPIMSRKYLNDDFMKEPKKQKTELVEKKYFR